MKKTIALILSLVMMLSIIPCQGIMATANAVDNNNFEASVFWYDFRDAYLSTVRDALADKFDAAGINYTNYDARSTQTTQNAQIDTAISQGTDLLIVNIVDVANTDYALAIVNKAKAADIPVIFFNREVEDRVINSYKNACFVGTRASEAGEMQGIMAGNYIVENYDEIDLNGDGKISYIMMKGQLGNPEADARTRYSVEFANAILNEARKPSLTYYDRNNPDRFQPSNWSKTTAFELMETALSTHPMDSNNPIEVVFANNDDAALGCIEALNNAGWNTGYDDDPSIPVFGIDYTADAQYAINRGQMTGSILQSAAGLAKTITALAENAANGKNVFYGAKDMFNVDIGSAKIRVPFEIRTNDGSYYPDYPNTPDYPDAPDYPDDSGFLNYPYYPDFGEGKVAVFWYDFSDAYLSFMRDALDEELHAAGVEYTNYDAQNTQATQNDQIDTAISQGADVLVVNLVDTAHIGAAQAIVDKAKAADLPVIFFNREIDDSVINSYDNACYVGVRPAEAGDKQGIMAGNYIVENYDELDLNGDGNISYIMMKGELGNPEAEARTRYSVEYTNEILIASGKPELVYYDRSNADKFQRSNWSKNKAFDLMETALSTNPMNGNSPIEVVFANNDDAALGCVEALNNAGWNTGRNGAPSIPVFGIDCTADAQYAISRDQMTGTIAIPRETMAYTIMPLIYNAINGRNVFIGAREVFNVDIGSAKIRVPYDIVCEEVYVPVNPNDPPSPSLPGNPDYPTEYPDFKGGNVSVFWYDFSDAFLSTVRDAMDGYLYKAGFTFVNYDANSSQRTQNDQIDTAISQGTDLLIVNIVDTASIDAQYKIVNKAKKANVPVIFFNREVADEVINSYANACFVGTRAAEAGDMQGIMAGDYIVENYDEIDLNGDGKISYIMMKGELGNPEAEARTIYSIKYANNILNEAGKPSLTYFDKNNTNHYEESNWSKRTAFDLMETALSTHPMDSNNPIEVVFANNDDAALGCVEALNNEGWNTGYYDDPSIPVFGIDYTADAKYAINLGRMTGSVLQSAADMAETVVILAENAANGNNVFDGAEDMFNVDIGSAKIRVPYVIVCEENYEPDYPDYPSYPDYPYYPDPEFPSMIQGDANGDYTVSNADLIIIARYLVELVDELPRASNADINGDGIITNSDLVNIARIIVAEPKPVDVVAGIFWYDFSDAFLSTVRYALDAELTEAGINFTNYDAAGTQATQNDQIDVALSQGANLLIVNIVDTAAIDAAQAIANKAKSVGVPVIFFNREVDDSVINSYADACFVGTRAAEAGEMQGQLAGDYIVENYDKVDLNGDGKISYIMMKGELGNPEAEARTRYSVEICNTILNEAGKPSLAYYDRNNHDRFQPSNWSKTTAFRLMRDALSTNPMNGSNPIEVVFCNNDDAALGCVEALNNAGWNTGRYGAPSIPVFGIDYTADAAEAIEEGRMTGSILMSATGMAETVAVLASNVSNGEHVFANAEDYYNVDEGAAKIRVPYEIKGY